MGDKNDNSWDLMLLITKVYLAAMVEKKRDARAISS